MIALPPQLRVLVATEPADFRKGIDALAAVCRAQLGQDPFSGAVFVFRNKRSTAVKLLAYDGHGFWLCLRRFSRGRIRSWPSATEPLSPLAAAELAVLLFQGDPRSADFLPPWRSVTPHAASSSAEAPRALQRHGSHSNGAARTDAHSRPTSVR